jgi:hypothetical protein
MLSVHEWLKAMFGTAPTPRSVLHFLELVMSSVSSMVLYS